MCTNYTDSLHYLCRWLAQFVHSIGTSRLGPKTETEPPPYMSKLPIAVAPHEKFIPRMPNFGFTGKQLTFRNFHEVIAKSHISLAIFNGERGFSVHMSP